MQSAYFRRFRDKTLKLNLHEANIENKDLIGLSNLKLTSLTEINLSGNCLTDISGLEGFANLVTLDLSFNPMLKDISVLKSHKKLTELILDGTGVEDEQIQELLSSLPKLRVINSAGNPIAGAPTAAPAPAAQAASATPAQDTAAGQATETQVDHMGKAVDAKFLEADREMKNYDYNGACDSIREAMKLLREVPSARISDVEFARQVLLRMIATFMHLPTQAKPTTEDITFVDKIFHLLNQGRNGLELGYGLPEECTGKIKDIKTNDVGCTAVVTDEGWLCLFGPNRQVITTINRISGEVNLANEYLTVPRIVGSSPGGFLSSTYTYDVSTGKELTSTSPVPVTVTSTAPVAPTAAPATAVAIANSALSLQDMMKLVPSEYIEGWLNLEKFAGAVKETGCEQNIVTEDVKSVLIFSEKVTFGEVKDGQYEEGLGIILPSLRKSDIRVAVVATTDKQRALIDKLNRGKRADQQVVYADSVPAVMEIAKAARYYYFKVASEQEADAGSSVTSITIIVKKILDAIGKVVQITDARLIDQMHEAARQFAIAA